MSFKGLALFILGMFYGSWMSTGDHDPVRILLGSFGVASAWLLSEKVGAFLAEKLPVIRK